MTGNQSAAVDHLSSFSVNRGHWDYDLPDPERDDAEALGLPLPGWVEGIPEPRTEARR